MNAFSMIKNLITILIIYLVIPKYSVIETISLVFSFLSIINFVKKVGKEFCILEIVKVLIVITSLLMPALFFHYFNKFDELANFFEPMPIASIDYYSIIFPMVIAFFLGINYPGFKILLPNDYFVSLRSNLSKSGKIPLMLIVIGISASFIYKHVPQQLTNFFQLFTYLTYVGLFYSFFSNFHFKNIIISFCLIVSFSQVIYTGMYFEIINFSVVIVLIAMQAKKANLLIKSFIMGVGIFLLLLIQTIKPEYRNETWDGNKRTANSSVYYDILVSKVKDPKLLFEPINILGFSIRLNHGLILAKVIYNVPLNFNYGYGTNIATSFASSFIPRFIWFNKPKTGGSYNIVRFLGDKDSVDTANSYNLGFIGEAYAHFGRWISLIYLFFFWFINSIYIFKINSFIRKAP